MTLVPASSHGSTFNGGTITQPLVIAPTVATSPPLTVQGPTGLIAAGFDLVEVLDENSSDRLQVFPDGGARVDAAAGEATRIVAHSGNQVSVSDTSVALSLSDNMILLTAPDKMGFFGASAIVQPAASDIAAALAALGLVAAGSRGATLSAGLKTTAITSGALPTVAPVTATAFQCSTTRDVFLSVPVTYNPGVATTATCKVELSPDNITFSELFTVTQPVGTMFDGSVEAVQLVVPAAWRVKLTVTNATLGTGTYY